MTSPPHLPSTKKVRCAIYTRKSTEEGLDLEFNSLDAQRESAEAYVASQKNEGWAFLPDRYDDGGFTGGNIERPALKRLMADIEAGRVDCVVVYKVDRLSRSLMDFARLMELFDRKGVSFVSVTQQFNTTHSMGRLTLNILLSFAQFEREIISERTRDKIAASRRKGKYSARVAPLGYDFVPLPGPQTGKRLAPNAAEAERVRRIFEMYLDERSLLKVASACRDLGWTAKGGSAMDKKILSKLLKNVLYVGRVPHGALSYPGEHEPIVEAELFERVQRQLKAAGMNGGAAVRNNSAALLKGLLRCGSCGCAMTATTATRKSKGGERRYVYYLCANAGRRGREACPCPSLPAGDVEAFVVDQVRAVLTEEGTLRAVVDRAVEILRGSARERASALDRLRTRVGRLAAHGGGGGRDLARERVRLGALEAAVAKDRERLLDEDELVGAVEAWNGVWNTLTPAERIELIREVVAVATYDAKSESITVELKPGVGTPAQPEALSA